MRKLDNMGITIKKIAEITGVSRGTVDRVLNNRPGVREEVRQRVLSVAEAMGYEPNIAGKALVKHNKPYNIGVILPMVGNDMIYSEINRGMEAAQNEFRDWGINVVYEYSQEYSVEDQISRIDRIIKKDISALAFVPINNKKIIERINELNPAIAPVTFVTDIEGINKLCFIGIDAEKCGRIAGDLLVKLLNNNDDIIIITTSKEVLAQKLKLKGLKDIFKEAGKEINIVGIYENYDRDDRTFEKVIKAFGEHKGIKGIYSATGLGIKGLGKALDIVDSDNNIRVITSDLIPDTIELLKNKTVDFTITMQPFNIGYETIKIISNYLLKGVIPNEVVRTRLEIHTIENYNE